MRTVASALGGGFRSTRVGPARRRALSSASLSPTIKLSREPCPLGRRGLLHPRPSYGCSRSIRLKGAFILFFAFLLFSTGFALACPACKDALYSSSDPKGYTRLTKGYARSIYLLMGTPYLVFAGVTLTIVRSARRNKK